MEDLVYQADGPQLNDIDIVYLDPPVDFQIPRLSTFLERSVGPKLTSPRDAHIGFHCDRIVFALCCHEHCSSRDKHVRTSISSDALDLHVSVLTQVLIQFSATFFTVVYLEVEIHPLGPLHRMENVEWLHLFHQFPALQMLQVSWELAGFVARALDGIRGETVAEVLPFLDLICLEDQPISSIEKFEFFAARRRSHRPITVVNTRTEFIMAQVRVSK